MQYNICKETTPRQTVTRIKEILSTKGIKLKETIVPFDYKKKNAPRSLRVYLINEIIGTNGKGTSYINSKASGYSEFMERLQNIEILNMDNPEFNIAPDEIKYNTEQLLTSEIAKFYQDKDTLNFLAKISSNFKNKFEMVPFYSVKEKNEVLLPINVIKWTQTSTGMAAGNTKEEALVQGISEICERYALKSIIFNQIIMPEIPKEEYLKYETISGMVKYLEKFGFKVRIKDASLGKKLPVICGLIENCQDKEIYIKFGAHPNFPVAVERTITELLQGIMINKDAKKDLKNSASLVSDIIQEKKIETFSLIRHVATRLSTKSKFGKIFLSKNAQYKFDSSIFMKESELKSNKEILRFLLNNIKDISNDDIYIRDVSFLGFPSVFIYIPSMSSTVFENENQIKKLYEICELYYSNQEKNELHVRNIMEKTIQYIEEYGYYHAYNIIHPVIILLYLLLKNDENQIKQHFKRLESYKYRLLPSQIIFNEMVQNYYKYKEKNYDEKDIIKKLSKKYNSKQIEYFLTIKNNLSIERVKKLLFREDKTDNLPEELEKIKNILINSYKDNIPNQKELKSIL